MAIRDPLKQRSGLELSWDETQGLGAYVGHFGLTSEVYTSNGLTETKLWSFSKLSTSLTFDHCIHQNLTSADDERHL